ncbi:MAG TPA: hypothetical protein VHU85_17810 [Acidimicrobiales bacterium]|nr:hypothetical protein [Acidimicrobiales bacterium]
MDEFEPNSVTTMSWPDPDEGPWAVMVHWRDLGGRAECIGLELWNGTALQGGNIDGREPSPITATALREIRPDALIKTAREKHVQDLAGVVDALHHYLREQNISSGRGKTKASPFVGADDKRKPLAIRPGAPETREIRTRIDRLNERRKWPEGGKQRGRPADKKHPPEHWERVAEVYRDAWAKGWNPTAEVEVAFGLESYSTAATWISRCRKKGLLPETKQGKPSAGSEE